MGIAGGVGRQLHILHASGNRCHAAALTSSPWRGWSVRLPLFRVTTIPGQVLLPHRFTCVLTSQDECAYLSTDIHMISNPLCGMLQR